MMIDNTLFFLFLYAIIKSMDRLYRWVRSKLGKPKPLRPLYHWEKMSRRLLAVILLGIVLGQELLAHQGLALRPSFGSPFKNLFFLAALLWLPLISVKRLSKQWNWFLYFGLMIAFLPFTFFIWFAVQLSGNNFEYDIVTENGKTYLHTSEQESWSDHYVHKYEVVNDYLMKSGAVDYDIHHLSERHYNMSYEEQRLSTEADHD